LKHFGHFSEYAANVRPYGAGHAIMDESSFHLLPPELGHIKALPPILFVVKLTQFYLAHPVRRAESDNIALRETDGIMHGYTSLEKPIPRDIVLKLKAEEYREFGMSSLAMDHCLLAAIKTVLDEQLPSGLKYLGYILGDREGHQPYLQHFWNNLESFQMQLDASFPAAMANIQEVMEVVPLHGDEQALDRMDLVADGVPDEEEPVAPVSSLPPRHPYAGECEACFCRIKTIFHSLVAERKMFLEHLLVELPRIQRELARLAAIRENAHRAAAADLSEATQIKAVQEVGLAEARGPGVVAAIVQWAGGHYREGVCQCGQPAIDKAMCAICPPQPSYCAACRLFCPHPLELEQCCHGRLIVPSLQ
jgi:hypothetical protein